MPAEQIRNTLFERIQRAFEKPDISVESLLLEINVILKKFEQEDFKIISSKPLHELISESIGFREQNTGNNLLFESGFSNLDDLTGGFFPGELVVFGGRPGMGKTQLIVNIILNLSVKYPVLYYSLDLSGTLLCTRFLSAMSSVSSNQILNNELSDSEKILVNNASKKLENHLVFIYDTGSVSFSQTKAQIIDHVNRFGVKVVVVDYIQLMAISSNPKYRDFELSKITRELKNLAKELNICIIATSQLSRAVEYRGGRKQPHLSDLRDSGTLEQDADKVIFIYRPEYYHINVDEFGLSTKGLTELIVAKNRMGGLGTANLLVDSNFTKFTENNQFNSELKIGKKRWDELESPF